MYDETPEIYISNANASVTVYRSPVITETSESASPQSSEITDNIEKEAQERRVKELEEWLKKIRTGDTGAWKEVPIGLNSTRITRQDPEILLQEGSLTPDQAMKPHCISEHKHKFATDSEYHAYVAHKKAWAEKHYPSGVEIVPVVTADGMKTIAIIGLTADQANAINDAVYEKRALEKQASLMQISSVEAPIEMQEQNASMLDTEKIRARVDAVVAETKIEPLGTPHLGATETIQAEVISSIPHSPEMQDALRQALNVSIEHSQTNTTALTVTYCNLSKVRTRSRTG